MLFKFQYHSFRKRVSIALATFEKVLNTRKVVPFAPSNTTRQHKLCAESEFPTATHSSMELSHEERSNALALKDAMACDSTLTPISDYEIVQHSLVAKGDTDKALSRMRKIQDAENRYKHEISGLSNSSALEKTLEKLGGTLTSFGLDRNGRPVIGCLYSRFDPKQLKVENDWVIVGQGLIALLAATTYEFDAVRNGCVFVADCQGMGWSNFSPEAEKRFAEVRFVLCPELCQYEKLENDSARAMQCPSARSDKPPKFPCFVLRLHHVSRVS